MGGLGCRIWWRDLPLTHVTNIELCFQTNHQWEPTQVKALKEAWKCDITTKMFGYYYKEDLQLEKSAKRRISSNYDVCCVFCFTEIEPFNHLFFSSNFSL